MKVFLFIYFRPQEIKSLYYLNNFDCYCKQSIKRNQHLFLQLGDREAKKYKQKKA